MISPQDVFSPEATIVEEIQFEDWIDAEAEDFLKRNFARGPYGQEGCRTFNPVSRPQGFTEQRNRKFVKRWRAAGWEVKWDGDTTYPSFYFYWPTSRWEKIKQWFRDRRFA